MSEINYQLGVTLVVQRCYTCRQLWALEKGRTSYYCPYRVVRTIERKNDEIQHEERRVRSLRGHITRLRRAK